MNILKYIAVAAVLSVSLAVPGWAKSLIRDADIEYALSQIARPVLSASGLPKSTRILVVNDTSLNAFVADNQHIFLNAGLIMKLKTARSLQYVIAHEAAHIANGHFARRAGNLRASRNAAGLGLILAAAAAAAGHAELGGGIALGSHSSALRNLLAHTRAEESSADISALRSLVRAGIDPQGAIEVNDIFRGQEALSARRQDPYMRSHPLTRDRLRAAKSFVAGNKRSFAPDPTSAYWFHRAQGKLSAFLRAPGWTLRRADASVSKDIAQMRKAVAHHRASNLPKALEAIDGAIAIRPGDPFYIDLKAEILMKGRRFSQSVHVYRKALSIAPRDPIILGGLGRAQLATGDPNGARKTLERARGLDFRDPRILRDLAVAYAKTGNNGMASLLTAERYALSGRLKDANLHAARAEALLPRGSGAWRRAQDVLDAAKRLR